MCEISVIFSIVMYSGKHHSWSCDVAEYKLHILIFLRSMLTEFLCVLLHSFVSIPHWEATWASKAQPCHCQYIIYYHQSPLITLNAIKSESFSCFGDYLVILLLLTSGWASNIFFSLKNPLFPDKSLMSCLAVYTGVC